MAANLDEPVSYHNIERRPKTPQPHAGVGQYRGALRLAVGCLGLMCILQGALNVVLRLHYTQQLFTRCNNQSVDGDQLQTSHNNLVKERDLLQNQYKTEIKEKQLLQKKLYELCENLNQPGWIYFSSSMYFISNERNSWSEGRKDCRQRGADLVIINSREEQEFVEMLRSGKEAWIGLTDSNIEDTWKWVDDTMLTTGYWLPREPNNYYGNEDCAMIGYQPEDNRPIEDPLSTWNDNYCSDQFVSICEKRIST